MAVLRSKTVSCPGFRVSKNVKLILTPVRLVTVKKRILCFLTDSIKKYQKTEFPFFDSSHRNVIKKRNFRILTGVKKGCQKTLYKYKIFF